MKTGNTFRSGPQEHVRFRASMEPGHEDREYVSAAINRGNPWAASMEPGHEDREYGEEFIYLRRYKNASMEPGHEDREYHPLHEGPPHHRAASMEPGHEDREYRRPGRRRILPRQLPQWSPVMKTGNTGPSCTPGHKSHRPQWSPVMKTGNTRLGGCGGWRRWSLNGARS